MKRFRIILLASVLLFSIVQAQEQKRSSIGLGAGSVGKSIGTEGSLFIPVGQGRLLELWSVTGATTATGLGYNVEIFQPFDGASLYVSINAAYEHNGAAYAALPAGLLGRLMLGDQDLYLWAGIYPNVELIGAPRVALYRLGKFEMALMVRTNFALTL
jgi:hypothetical protein